MASIKSHLVITAAAGTQQRSLSPPLCGAKPSRRVPNSSTKRVRPAQLLVDGFAKAWVQRLLKEQILVQELTDRTQALARRADAVVQDSSKLSTVVSTIAQPLQLREEQQAALGVKELQGPVLDSSLMTNLSCSSLDKPPVTSPRCNAHNVSSSSSSDSSSSDSTRSRRKKRSSKRNSKSNSSQTPQSTTASQQDFVQQQQQLSAVVSGVQLTNNLLLSNNRVCTAAAGSAAQHLANSRALDKRAEEAYLTLMAAAQLCSCNDSADGADGAAAAECALEERQCLLQHQQQQQQLFAVYHPPENEQEGGNSKGPYSSCNRWSTRSGLMHCVQLLRLPDQLQEYQDALQEGLLVVPLQDPGGDGAPAAAGDVQQGVSVAELAWQEQQQRLLEQQQEQQDIFFGGTVPDFEAAPDDDVNDDEEEEDTSNSINTSGPDSSPDNSSGSDSSSSDSEEHTTIKVDVGVKVPTKPGQDVVLVGSHPSLGSWSVDGALPLTWTDGHVWRGGIEVPKGCTSFEYKAVLRCSKGTVWEAGSNRQMSLQAGGECVSLEHTFGC